MGNSCWYYGACLYTSPQMAHEAGPKIRDILKETYPAEWASNLEEEGDESRIIYIGGSSVYFQLDVVKRLLTISTIWNFSMRKLSTEFLSRKSEKKPV